MSTQDLPARDRLSAIDDEALIRSLRYKIQALSAESKTFQPSESTVMMLSSDSPQTWINIRIDHIFPVPEYFLNGENQGQW